MNTESPPQEPTGDEPPGATAESERHSPEYWKRAFSGKPLAIFVPPYIRFLQGQVALRKAIDYLVASRRIAETGIGPLGAMLGRSR
jgi:hypothetical protein